MSDASSNSGNVDEEHGEIEPGLMAAIKKLKHRCDAANIPYTDVSDFDGDVGVELKMKNGRNFRPLSFWTTTGIEGMLALPFEKYVFLGDLEAICSYTDGIIEVGLRQSGSVFFQVNTIFKRLLGNDPVVDVEFDTAKLILDPPNEGLPNIEISRATPIFRKLSRAPIPKRLTLKLKNCTIKSHDTALDLIHSLVESVLFQIDLVSGLALMPERRRQIRPHKRRKAPLSIGIEYPRNQYEKAPLALYNYGRSAVGMPLLQFLAFYQVMEFYFPIYSQSEAHRKLKSLLKDPAFRVSKDSDISRLLAAIQTTRGGGFGDERAQLKATMIECTDADSIRAFLESDSDRKEFFLSKSKYHKIPIANPELDLRADVAERIYDIRCKIVHTKSDSRDSSFELLLPFTPEAEQLAFDIELVEFVAQRTLIIASTPLNLHG